MFYKTVLVYLFVVIKGVYLISNNPNQTAEILWNLSNLAVQSRQNYGSNPYNYKYTGKYPQYYQKPTRGQYGLYQGSYKPYPQNYKPYYPTSPQNQQYYPQNQQYYPQNQQYYPQNYRPTPPNFGLANHQQSFMNALHSISRNDDLQCVPKLLCEVTSGTLSESSRQGFGLPFNINMESLVGLLSAVNGAESSPLLFFGKAALLGYTSKGNTGSCQYAYPRCPSDPDRLVQYLNNHNGGFFRFFNGLQQGYPSGYKQNSIAEQRIQTKPAEYIPSNFISGHNANGIKFPVRLDDTQLPFGLSIRSEKGLKFPPTEELVRYAEQPFRKPKELPYDIYYYHSNHNDELDIQRPLPNHKASPMIFPVRTGTGDLRLDPEELNDRQPFALQNNNIISFNPDLANDAFYYSNFNANANTPEEQLAASSSGFRQEKKLFSFPEE